MATYRPTHPQLLSAVAAAVWAPSVHNTQPWLFRPVEDGLEVFPDWRRQLRVADPTGRALRLSCGAAILNLRLALRSMGLVPQVDPYPDRDDGPLARVVVIGQSPPTPAEAALYAAIGRRHSNRFPFLDTEVSAAERVTLVQAAEQEGAWLSLVVGQAAVELVVAMMRLADRTLMADDEYVAELGRWSRRDPGSVDGVSREAGGPAPEVQDLLIGRDFGGAARAPGRDFEPDPFVAVLGTFVDSPVADIDAGQALQRVLLTATRHGLSASMASQAIEVPPIREQLRMGLRRHGPPQMVLRLGRGPAGASAGRRPIEDVVLGTDEAVPAPVPL
jgi:nitroreductase